MKIQNEIKKIWAKPIVKVLSVKENTKGGTGTTMEAGSMKTTLS